MTPSLDTIFALSSGRPPAAIAVVRISGPQAGRALQALAGKMPPPRHAALATLRDPASREPIDQAVVLWFPGPNSETGEDIAELQLHGGRAVIAAALDALSRIDGLRPAEAGEFTRRAFENGRIDLTAVEGLADLIGAETEAQRRQAFRQLRGLLGDRAEGWRRRLIEALALVEAGLDFSDEADVPADVAAPALRLARELRDEIGAVLADAPRGERLREGLTIAIAGPPNAGKSSLFNWLAGRDAAIVSPYPGTTRDVLEVHLDLGGYPLTVLDTAGVRDSTDPVEAEGVRRAQARAAEADLVLWVTDAAQHRATAPPDSTAGEGAPARWMIFNKIDLLDADALRAMANLADDAGERSAGGAPDADRIERDRSRTEARQRFPVSVRDGTGLETLLAALADFARETFGGGEPALITRARHRHNLNKTYEILDHIMNTNSYHQLELIAEELRLAARALGRLTGRIDVEDVLNVIFREFCIGK